MAKKRDLCKGSKPKNDAVHFLPYRSKKKLGCCKSVTNKSSEIIPLEKVMSDDALPESIAKVVAFFKLSQKLTPRVCSTNPDPFTPK